MADEDAAQLRLADREDDRRFVAITGSADGEEVAGYAEYRRGPRRITFTHTVVEPRFEGRGVASRLIRHALDDSRRRGLAVTAICPFVRSYIERHEEYQDLLAPPAADGAPGRPDS